MLSLSSLANGSSSSWYGLTSEQYLASSSDDPLLETAEEMEETTSFSHS